MALHDWNRNGEEDVQDRFIQYQIYKNVMGSNKNNSNSSGDGCGCLLSIVAMFIGIVLTGAFFITLGLEIEELPRIVILIVLIPVVAFIGAFLHSIFE